LCEAANPDDVPKILKQKIQSEKCLISIIWGGTGIKSLLHIPKGMKYSTIFFVESVVPLWWNISVRRVGGKRFEASWSIWTMRDRTTTEKVRQLLLQQKNIESLPQLTVQIYRRVASSFLECSRNECREHHTARRMN
jgi:hypothetical protein